MRSVQVQDHQVDNILLDTGCSWPLVREQLVPEEKLLEGQACTIQCPHGDMVLYPLAEVEMELYGVPVRVKDALSSTLPMTVLLRIDVSELSRLHGGNSGEMRAAVGGYCSDKIDTLTSWAAEESKGYLPHKGAQVFC